LFRAYHGENEEEVTQKFLHKKLGKTQYIRS
jgi:hypothetical protein